MNETVKIWISELLTKEIKEVDGAIKNEKIWTKADSIHEGNIADLEEYKEILTEILTEYGEG